MSAFSHTFRGEKGERGSRLEWRSGEPYEEIEDRLFTAAADDWW